jgi:hypothetical protein
MCSAFFNRSPSPLINQILLSCSFQPEIARLDSEFFSFKGIAIIYPFVSITLNFFYLVYASITKEPLLFSWMSGIECNKTKKLKYFDSEALMFELVLSLMTYALSESNLGCDFSVSGDFGQALKKFTKSTGIFQFLGENLLPDWMAKSKQHAEMEKESLAETRVGVAVALTHLHMAMSQVRYFTQVTPCLLALKMISQNFLCLLSPRKSYLPHEANDYSHRFGEA